MNVALWIGQGLLAVLFLFGGVVKLTMPIEELTAQVPLPGLLLQLVSAAEVLGALGLVLPGLTRIRTGLTPLAAVGLMLIMVGAVVITAATMDVASALFPLVTGVFAAFVAFGRWQLAPHRRPARRPSVLMAA